MAIQSDTPPAVKQQLDPDHQKNNRPATNTLKYLLADDDHNRDNFSSDMPDAEFAASAFENAHTTQSIDGKKIRFVGIIAGGNRRTVQGGSKDIIEGGEQLAAWGVDGGLHTPPGWQDKLKGQKTTEPATTEGSQAPE